MFYQMPFRDSLLIYNLQDVYEGFWTQGASLVLKFFPGPPANVNAMRQIYDNFSIISINKPN